jgi:hypothetical protein
MRGTKIVVSINLTLCIKVSGCRASEDTVVDAKIRKRVSLVYVRIIHPWLRPALRVRVWEQKCIIIIYCNITTINIILIIS